MNKNEIEQHIIALEKNALQKWIEGDASGYLDLYAEDASYFDPFWDKRLEGHKEMENFYENFVGVFLSSYEMKRPMVCVTDQMAVLSYELVVNSGNISHNWNCSEVYMLQEDGGWKIVHSHWSFYRPM